MKVKNISQKTLSFFLSIVMLFSCFNIINVSAEDSSEEDSNTSDYNADSYNGVSGSQWEFDAYYIEQDDKYYVEKNSNFSLKYQMEFHTSRDLEANSVEIKIPAALLTYRNGTVINPTEIAIPNGTPDSPVQSKTTSFNYYIDSDNNLNFFNYEKIESGSNMVWQVLYKNLNAMSIEDETSWSLEPTIKVKINDDTTEEKTAKALEGLVDTSVTLQSVSKEILRISDKNYGPGLYTQEQVEQYISGKLPSWCSGSNFNNYVYVVWDVKATGNGNQPWSMTVQDISSISSSSVKGYVVGYKDAYGNKYNNSIENSINNSQSDTYTKQIIENSSNSDFKVRFFVVSAYPKSSVPEGKLLTNSIDITLTPLDGKDDAQTKSDSAEWAYSDYDWKYAGNIIGISKNGNSDQKGMLELYKQSLTEDEDKVKLSYASESSCYGYGFTHNIEGSNIGKYIDGTSYTVCTFDDVIYAYPAGSDKTNMQMLGSDDYYFTKVVVTQTDKGYDVWEDDYAAPENADGIDQKISVYAMYEDSTEWEFVADVSWSDSGIMKYTFTSEQLARKPWRVKAEHTSINYSTKCKIDVEVCLRHDSPIINNIIESNPNIEELVIENLSGVTGINDGVYFHDSGEDNYQQYPENLKTVSDSLYGILPMRDNAATKITNLTKQAASYKKAKSSNDVTNGRVNVEYTITAYDGYEISTQETAKYLSEVIESPGRKDVVFYDLLPYGMKFDPSKPVNVGRITDLSKNTYQTQYKSWNSSQVTVTVDTEDNCNGTGRTLVAFHISYSGEDDSSSYSSSLWFEGWGVNFSAYYEWKDIEVLQKGSNISAFMPETGDKTPLLGLDSQVSRDDGSKGGVYKDFGEDINEDEITDIRNVLYAQNSTWDNVITSSSSRIEKLVKSDNDTFGVFKQETIVDYNSGYTYEITLSNTEGELKNIVIYDRLENAAVDRGEYDSIKFDDKSWHGTFVSVVTKGFEQLGIAPVIYYNAGRDAAITTEKQAPSNILTEEKGWYTAENWTQPLSDVKAIAVDISKTTDGKDFVLEKGQSVSFQIKMTAPKVDEQLGGATYAYNNTAYYSYNTNTSTDSTVISNSTRVRINESETLEVQKEFEDKEEVPEQLKNNSFEFYLYQESSWNESATSEKINFANKEYKLFTKDENGDWILSDGLYATDANGMLTLHADEKAVFEDLPDASTIKVKEEDNIFWESAVETTEDTTEGTYTVNVKNKYRPILYLQKKLQSVPSGLDVSDYTFTFQIFADEKPLADAEFWYVDKALTNGGIPNKVTTLGDNGVGKTNENGYVTIHAGEVIAVSPGDIGTEYKIVEIQNTTESNLWICENNTVEGTVSLNGSSATFTNIYRLKDLYITKEITHQDASECTQEFTFKITDNDGNSISGNKWVLLDSDGNKTETYGTLDENGEFTVACAGQTVKVEGFKANETYIIQETDSGTLYKAVNNGIAEVTMPLYSLSADVTITNDYLKRPLSVSKTVMYDVEDTTKAAEVAQKSFTMTATVNGKPVANYPYTVVDSYGNSSTGKTGDDGTFEIKNGETVTFEDVGRYGDSFTVTETSDADYPQIYPANGNAHTGTLSQDENKVSFINGAGKNLIISKQYVGNDEISNQYAKKTKGDVSGSLLSSVKITLKYKGTDGTIKVWPKTDTTVKVIDSSGSISEKTWAAGSSMTISAWSMVIIPEGSIPPDAVYYVSESEKNQHRTFLFSYSKDDGSYEMHYLEINQKIPANDAPVTGTIESNPVATIVNEVDTMNVGSVIEKRMTIGSDPVPEGAKLVWRVERYVNGEWRPAENIKYMATVFSNLGREVVGDRTMYTDSDGVIELTKKANSAYLTVKFIDVKVHINVQNPVEGDLRVVELQNESDEAWGMLAGYGNADDLSVSTSLDSDSAVAFVNSNVNTPVEIEKVMETDCDKTFAMTLRQVTSSSEYPITKTEQITESVIRTNIPYTVYDSETGDKVSEVETDQYGNIYLKAGQFARLELPDSTVWTVSEETDPKYQLKKLSGSPEDDERLTKLNDNLMLIRQQYSFDTEDITITSAMVASGLVYNGETGKKVTVNTGDVDIPEYIIVDNKKYRVTGIGDSAFSGNTKITGITLPDTLKTIGNDAFSRCTNLKAELTIPNGVTSIGRYAFSYSGLTKVTIPGSVVNTGDYAFYYCTNLKSVNIQNGVKSIGGHSFHLTGLTEVAIPDSVTSIGSYAFNSCSGLTTLDIKNGVTSIGDYAFSSCTSLTGNLTIPGSVKSIGNNAFNRCSGLTTLDIQNGVTSIGNYAFSTCTGLTGSLTIPSSVTSIGDHAFYYTSLTAVDIQNGSIGNYAFQNCKSLTTLNIQNGVTIIGNYAFSTCTNLTGSLTIPSSVTKIETRAFEATGLTEVTIPGSVGLIGYNSFQSCKKLEKVTIEEGVKTIGASAFCYCDSLTEVTIPSGVTSIGNSAFYVCSSLTEITIPGSVGLIGYNSFRSCKKLEKVTIEEGVKTIGASAFYDCTSLAEVIIPTSVTSIGDNAFYNCTGLTGSLIIPSGVKTIGASAFYDCTSLAEVIIPTSVTSIGDNAFYNCTGLTTVTIPTSVTSIGDAAFSCCEKLTSIEVDENNENYSSQDGILFNKDKTILICYPAGKTGAYTIPSSVTDIGNSAFRSCTGLTEVTIPSNVTSIGNYAFYNCTGLTEVTIPSNVTSIGEYAFYNCTGLTGSLTIPSSVTSIGNDAFYNCTGLTGSLIIPSSVTDIGSGAFCNCTGLTGSLTIPSSVTGIGNYTFYNCTGLTEIIIPNSVTSIDMYAFSCCKGLTEITIPSSVTGMGYRTFYNCKGLTKVTIENGVTSIASEAFRNCTSLTEIIIPSSVTSIESYAFWSCTSLSEITIPSSVTSIESDAFTGCSALTSITVNKAESSISGSPWNATNATVTWTGE